MMTPRSLDPTKVLKHLVSKQKRRLIVDGFDLDLTYVTEQVARCPASAVRCLGTALLARTPSAA